MRYLKYFALLGALLFISVGSVKAQDYGGDYYSDYGAYGPPPVCSYGYFSYYPYACAPYGYWGPSYFANGVFIGVGPWYGWGYGHGFYGRGRYGHGYYGRGGYGRGYYGRGFSGNRGGFAYHGGGARGTLTVNRPGLPVVTLPAGGRGIDQDGNGVVTPGDVLRYTLVFSNTGTTTLTNVALTDTIPTGLTSTAPPVTSSIAAPSILVR